jgi:biopolymer transport protein ExbD/biopolymer transport protein TolR
MGMQAGGGSGGFQSEINVTPMVDIMLVLLIIFMVVTPFLQKGVTVAIPRDTKWAEEDTAINKETSVIVAIPNDGEYWLGKKRVTLDDLKIEVDKALSNKEKKDRIVYVKSGVGVSYKEVVRVINAVREKGIDQIGLVADKKKGGATAPAPAPAG